MVKLYLLCIQKPQPKAFAVHKSEEELNISNLHHAHSSSVAILKIP